MKNVYIVLSQTGTIFSRAIRLYTRDQYNHASMSFDSKLLVMYSFGRRKRYNLLDSGFVIENFARGMDPLFPQYPLLRPGGGRHRGGIRCHAAHSQTFLRQSVWVSL